MNKIANKIPEQNSIPASAKIKKDIDMILISSLRVPISNAYMYITTHIISDINKNFKKLAFELVKDANNNQKIKFQKHIHDCITTIIVQYTRYLCTVPDPQKHCNKHLDTLQQENLLA